MACSCGNQSRRTYYANLQLFTEKQNGLVAGASPPFLAALEITVCPLCGKSEFQIPSDRLRYFTTS